MRRGCPPARLPIRDYSGAEVERVVGLCRGWAIAPGRVMPAECRQIGLVLENPQVRIEL